MKIFLSRGFSKMSHMNIGKLAFVVFASILFGHIRLSAQCNCSDSFKRVWRYTATEAVLHTAALGNDRRVLDSLLISQDSVNKVLNGLCAISKIKSKASDSVFDLSRNFKLSYFAEGTDLNNFFFDTDTGVQIIKNLYHKKPSGSSRFNRLIQKGRFKVHIDSGGGMFGPGYGFTLKSDTLVNPMKVVSEIQSMMTLISGGEAEGGHGPYWYVIPHDNVQYFRFTYAWGDCFAGCMFKRTWYFADSGDCHVSSAFAAEPAKVNRLFPVYVGSNSTVTYCPDAYIHYPIPKETNSEYQAETGGSYGKWYLNGVAVADDTQQLFATAFGTYVLTHEPNDSMGVHVQDTIFVVPYNLSYAKGFYAMDSLVLCPSESLKLPTRLIPAVAKQWKTGEVELLGSDTIIGSSPKMVRSLMRNSNFCIGHDSIYVRRSAFPSASGLADTVFLYAGDSALLKPDSNWKSATYKFWDASQSNSFATKIFNPAKAPHTGLYANKCYLINIDNCEKEVVFFIRYYGTPKLNKLASYSGRQQLQIYPNPASSLLFANISPQTLYEICDISGRQIATRKYEQNGMDISMLKSGNYLLKLPQLGACARFVVVAP